MINIFKNNILALSIFALSFVTMIVFLAFLFPSSYDKCIKLGSIVANNKESVNAVYSSCKIEFKSEYDEINSAKKLTDVQLIKLEGRMGPSSFFSDPGFSDFIGKIYNGNTDITIRRIVISVGNGLAKKQYSIDTYIEPLTYKDVSVTTLKTDDNGWDIVDAYGSPYN